MYGNLTLYNGYVLASFSGDVEFRVSNGDACVFTRDNATLPFGQRWCLSQENGTVVNIPNGYLEVTWDGRLKYLVDVGNLTYTYFTLGEGGRTQGPSTLCVEDCGLVKLYDYYNDEVWVSPQYYNPPYAYPTCSPAPTNSPSMISVSPYIYAMFFSI